MGFKIRAAIKDDCAEIDAMIQELAAYEKMPNSKKITTDTLLRDGGFLDANAPKYFHSYVAFDSESQIILGYVLFFYNYSTWEGRGIWMEDLYVRPEYRGQGIGKSLWHTVTLRAKDEDCCRVDFYVLSWNLPSIGFYVKNGAVNISEDPGWHIYRLDKRAIADFCGNSKNVE